MITIDSLLKFCGKFTADGNSVWLNTPFTIDDYTFATDGRILVRVPKLSGVSMLDASHINGVMEVTIPLDVPDHATVWEPLDAAVIPPFEKGDCMECFGDECDKQYCRLCEGTGQSEKYVPVLLGNKKINSVYLRKIVDLPGLLLAPNMTPRTGVMPFRFDGGRGLLMPMRWEAA